MKFERGVEVVGSAIIERGDGKILVVRSPKWSNKWTFPGGHIESGETIASALEREAEEETGLKLKPIDVIAYGELIGSKDFHRPAHFIYFDLYCRVTDADIKNLKLDGNELTEHRWIAPKDALKLDLAESYRESIEKFIEYLDKKYE
ncbi:MAG: NUDIX domain-containing protein [Candidatus Berkelbacteria bacterium]|nr:NUDIX domain-containing protein [Candidatus Berkelbacteria bacterium]